MKQPAELTCQFRRLCEFSSGVPTVAPKQQLEPSGVALVAERPSVGQFGNGRTSAQRLAKRPALR